MPTWWPFGRKRRRNKSEKNNDANNNGSSEKGMTRDSERAPTFREKLNDPSDPNAALLASSSPPSRARQFLSDLDPFSPSQSQPHTAQTSTLPTENPSLEEITALPVTRRITSPNVPRSSEGPGRVHRRTKSRLQTNYVKGPHVPPSLHSKRSATHDGQVLRKKSNKKKRDQNLRESQIKAMSSPIPIPRRHDADARIRAALVEGSSAVSLPRAPSVRSSVTAMSDNQYEVGGIDVFSPRPTIRYSIYNANNNPASTTASRTVSRADERYERDISPRKVLKESKTIDDLADDYDAGGLRELMERDHRRRERRRKAQEERARRRLERYAESGEPGPSVSQRREEPRAANRLVKPKPLDTGLGLVGVQTGPSRLAKAAEPDPVKETEDLTPPNPFADNESEVVTPVEDPLVNTAREIRYSSISTSPPVTPVHTRNRSQGTDPRSASSTNIAAPASDLDRRASTATNKRTGPLSSLFRRSALGRRTSAEVAESLPTTRSFSNTSRESMSRQLPPAHLRDRPTVPRARSGTPTRTMSRFREDLPELPPASAMPTSTVTQSPDTTDAPAGAFLTARQREKMPEGLQGGEAMFDSRAESPSVNLLSQSMASVDSEGSWLSGRPHKRTSLQSSILASPEGRTTRGQSSKEKIEASENPYFGRSDPVQSPQQSGGIANALADRQAQAGQNEGRVVDVARRPTLVKQQGRQKSSEGLLKELTKDGEEQPTPATIVPASTATIHKSEEAESEESQGSESPHKPTVALAHTRSVSRGSAKLLEITRTGSVASRDARDTPPPPPAMDH